MPRSPPSSGERVGHLAVIAGARASGGGGDAFLKFCPYGSDSYCLCLLPSPSPPLPLPFFFPNLNPSLPPPSLSLYFCYTGSNKITDTVTTLHTHWKHLQTEGKHLTGSKSVQTHRTDEKSHYRTLTARNVYTSHQPLPLQIRGIRGEHHHICFLKQFF